MLFTVSLIVVGILLFFVGGVLGFLLAAFYFEDRTIE
jgi:hypothetical protein